MPAARRQPSSSEGARLATAAAGLLGLLSNDNGQTLRARLVSGPLHAAPNGFALNADGSLIYVPSPGFTGVDGFLYEAHDGTTASNLATVTITVLPAGAAPVAPTRRMWPTPTSRASAGARPTISVCDRTDPS